MKNLPKSRYDIPIKSHFIKIILIVSTFGLVVSLSACGGGEDSNSPEQENLPEQNSNAEADGTAEPENDSSAPPVATINPGEVTGTVPLEIVFSGSDSSDDVAIASYQWEFGDGTNAVGETITHTFTEAGNYLVSLTVADTDSLTNTATVNITVEPQVSDRFAPTAVIDFNTLQGAVPLSVVLSGTRSSGDGGITDFQWDFGDGSEALASEVTHVFTEAGAYTVSLIVVDAEGETDTASINIVVTSPQNDNGGEAVPMFVAAGYHGRRVLSCDMGRTWIADQIDGDPDEFDNLHRRYSPRKLIYADGTFVFLTGWGQPGQVLVSKNGIDWLKTTFDGFGYYSAVGYDNGRFVVTGNGGYNQISSNGGDNWGIEYSTPPSPVHSRAAGVFEGVWAISGDGVADYLLRGSDTWERLNSCTGPRHSGALGDEGGFAAGLGILVSVGERGDTCMMEIASGTDLGAGQVGTSLFMRGKPIFDGENFIISSGASLHVSTDGFTWDDQPLPEGMELNTIARADSGTYVGTSGGGTYFYSDDGEQWFQGTGPDGDHLTDLVFGFGSASDQCPEQ